MKKLLILIAVILLAGCAREYECDVGTFNADTGEFNSLGETGTVHQNTVGVDWPDGEREAVENCENTYNELASEEEVTLNIICRCEKAN